MIHFISQPSSRPIIFFTLSIFSLSSISAQAHDNLGLETGNLTGWTATGDAWNGQPVKGNTVTPRRSSAASQHVGNHWIGGYEPSRSDTGTGTLTSDPFKVTHPWASFLIGGGDHKGTRVEILDTTSGKKLFQAHGRNRENMSRVVVDLRKHQGEKISIRLVDEVKTGWGHINYDDFQFHQSRPPIKPRRISSSPLLKHLTPNPGDAKNSTVRSMYVPKGFQVDLIASEPDIRQPIAFTFDAKGRIWLAEALAYPHRQKDGKGQDRLVILEDSDGNGSFETKKIFADKLNLVSGFEIGYGGVFVGAAPHLLFIPDANGDDQPDGPAKVLLDGWDLKDTHETPNSFMWGHDGWLYGCHGVFNDSYVGKPGTPKDKRTLVKAGVWRFHPVTRKFEIYAHGGSNQWGLDYHPDGAMFMTHCRSSWGLGPVSQVIRDGHYWTQDNKNHRPFIATAKSGWNNVTVPHSNLIRSVSAYGHGEGGAGKPGSRAIYGGHSHVGTMIYLGDNWPEQYRGNLFTHNLHGHQMNREILTLTDSGYRAESEGNDQLYAPDKHYLAVDLKYGPDGAVYSIDWHDTQQCHSNNHAIWDRTNGRIYRMAWKQTYRPVQVDLTKSSDTELLQFLSHKNEWFARMAQHQLRQRAANNRLDSATANILAEQLFHPQNPHRLRALVALYGINGITKKTYQKLLRSPEETIRTQAVHYITEQEHAFSSEFQNALATLARTDTSARVRLALAGACQHRIDPKIAKGLLRLLAMRQEDADDQFIPKMIWFAYAQFADQDIDYALAIARESKLPEFRNSVFWYAARKDLDKAVEHANQLTDPKQVSRFIAIVHQVLAGKKTAKAPAGWDKLVLKANSDPATQKHFTALNKIFNGQSTNKDTPAARITQGKAAFMICAACHVPGKTQPGPSLEEIAQVYTNKNDIIQWIKKPGKKRANYPAMPAFNHMDDHSLQLIAEYLLSVKKTSPTKKLPATTVGFKKIQLFDKYITEGASIGDVNADGKPDIIAGPLWWQGPDFKKSHAYAPVKIYPIKGPGMSAYSSNFFTFPDLITKDKWTDILKVGLPGQPAHLAINPGEKPLPADNTKHQCEHSKAQDHICNESPQYVQALPGEKKQLLSFSKGHITLSIPTDDPKKPWRVLNITPPNSGIKMGEHGLGIGDINGDKLPDILEKRGWWQQPKNWDRKTHWKFHPFPFAPQQGGAQMFSYDINGDGLNDVVTALNAHSWGMAWYQQVRDGAKITFIKHTVMTDKPEGNPYGVCFSQPHAMSCADIDGDGIKDIVTGKCFYAHNGRDPGAEQPAVLYWFKTTRHKDGTTELMPYQIDNNSGVGRQISTGDLNGDSKMDIVVGNKKGVFAFIQK